MSAKRTFLIFCWLFIVSPPFVQGQVIAPPNLTGNATEYPNVRYTAALELYRDGRFKDAVETFQDALRGGRTSIHGAKWIDSIPSWCMLGECFYQSGDLTLAHDNFDVAIQHMLKFDGWLVRLQWPLQVTSAPQRNAPAWGRPRSVVRAQTPTSVVLAVGVLDQTNTILREGTIRPPELISIDAIEILRGFAVTLYRRADLLGPLAVDDPLGEQLTASLTAASAVSSSWPRPILSTLVGLSLAMGGKTDQAIVTLQSSISLPGNLDHPLSPIARVALAKLLYRSGQVAAADQLMVDATVSAAMWRQPEWIAEALACGVGPAVNRLQTNELYAAASGAVLALGRDYRAASAHCTLIAAEIAVANGKPDEANRRLTEVMSTFNGRRPVGPPRLHAYGQYVRAITAAAQGNANDAVIAAGTAVTMVRGTAKNAVASPRLYQLSLVAKASRNGGQGEITAEKRLDNLLNTADPWLWSQDPAEAIALQSTDLEDLLSIQLEITRRRGKEDLLVLRFDALQRNAFRHGLPFGGRLLDLRWFAACPEAWLTEPARVLREKPVGGLDVILQATQQAAQAIEAVRKTPIVDDPKSVVARRDMFTKAESAADAAEMLLLRASISRRVVLEVFPPTVTAADLRQRIPDRGAICSFCRAGEQMYGLWATKTELKIWPIVSRGLTNQVQQLLSILRTKPDKAAEGSMSDWKATSQSLARILFPDDWKLPTHIHRIVFVPTDALWMLPMELLPSRDESDQTLGDRCLCSYAPTIGLAINPVPMSSSAESNGFVMNRLFLPRDVPADTDLMQGIQEIGKPAYAMSADNYGSGKIASAALRYLWVMSSDRLDANVTSWSPLVYDRTLPGGTLSDWMRLPWPGPQALLLPGLDATGSPPASLFQLSCGLHAAAVPGALISRWPVGGASTACLVRETLLDLPEHGLLDAWHRARSILRNQNLEGATEPLLGVDAAEKTAHGDQLRFWAGYMLLDGFRTTNPTRLPTNQ